MAILAFGTLLQPALAAGEALGASAANMRWIKPLDLELLRELAQAHEALVAVEEGCVQGGAGAAVLEALQAEGLVLPVLQFGLPDTFIGGVTQPNCRGWKAWMRPVSRPRCVPALALLQASPNLKRVV